MLAWSIQLTAEESQGFARSMAQGGHQVTVHRARPVETPRGFGMRLDGVPSALPAADEEHLLELVQRVREGDLTAFERLYQLTRADAARTLHHLVGNRSEVEDLLQETYLRLLHAVKRFRGEARFRTFFYRVCANVALSHLRWRRSRPEDPYAVLPELPAPGVDPEREAARRQAARLIGAALDRLKPKKRIVFVYHELCEMGPDEIAEAMGCSPNTVRSRLHHARLDFTEALQRLLQKSRAGGPHGAP